MAWREKIKTGIENYRTGNYDKVIFHLQLGAVGIPHNNENIYMIDKYINDLINILKSLENCSVTEEERGKLNNSIENKIDLIEREIGILN